MQRSSARREPPARPGGELVLDAPPEPEKVVPAGLLLRLLPVLMLVGALAFVAVAPDQPTSWLFGGMFALSSLGMIAAGSGRATGGSRAALHDEDRRDYLRYLATVREQVRAIAAQQRVATETVHPDPAAWPAVLAGGRVWERRADDDDFGHVRLGRGTTRLATRLVAPKTGPVDGLEPVTTQALRRFLTTHSVVDDLPLALSLRASPTVWLEPAEPGSDLVPARALARALVAQYVLWHGPDDALLGIAAPPEQLAEWDWVKWLPHAAHPRHRDALGPIRMLTTEADEARRWWSAELADRLGEATPHLLLVVDGAAQGPGRWAAASGVTVLRVGAPPARQPGPSVVRLRVEATMVSRVGGTGEPIPLGRPDAFSVADALAMARRLAPYDLGAAPESDTQDTGLPALLGTTRDQLDQAGIAALRARRTALLRVPLGRDDRGDPVVLDLKEAALGGCGPHGLCVGATGSGKSELLRTLVVGLAATHSPAELNLVLVDFKGGATFLGLATLPHVSAVITNLVDELTLVDRMVDALTSEITRRQQVLRDAGNLAGVTAYAALRTTRSDLPPLPALLVVVDEFSELLAQRPELIDQFVMIGRLGRSLGVHLLLASQRLDEGRLRGLESHLSYRIALRTFSAAESRAVLGVPDAYQLPSTPGAAFLSTGTDELVRFRAAYVSGAEVEPHPAPRSRRVIHRFGIEPVALPDPEPATGSVSPSVVDTVVAAVATDGPPAHRVWLPPLAEPPPLDALPGVDPAELRVVVGLVDRPERQRHDPLTIDLASSHLTVVGAPRMGKSTALVTVVTALAQAHPPSRIGVHALDFGGGALSVLAGLPHVGTVADRQQPDLVRRVVAELTAAVARRERLFRAAGIASIEEFRARRAAGAFPDEPATDLLLVVDGCLTLRTDFDDVEARLLPLAAQGLAYGVHLALSAARWSELRPAVKDLVGNRLELRLGEPAESEVDRRRAAAVPEQPGHGLAADGAASVVAAPRTARTGTTELVARIAAASQGGGMAPVRLLPSHVTLAELPSCTGSGLPIGIDEDQFALVELDLRTEPHLLCFADAESGKTNLLRLIAHGIVTRHTPEQARIVVVDPRRGLIGVVPASHGIGYASTPEATAAAAEEIAEALRRRRPGTEVTADQLRDGSWRSDFPEVYVLVDDYDLVTAGAATHPLRALTEFLPVAKDVGLHLVITRRCGGAGRALYDPVLGALRELGTPGLVMNGSRDEGTLVENVRPAAEPPGRGTLVDRRHGARRVQLAWLAPDAE